MSQKAEERTAEDERGFQILREHLMEAIATDKKAKACECSCMPHWRELFDSRQNGLIGNCITYSLSSPSGLPGHNLMLIVAKMARLLDEK